MAESSTPADKFPIGSKVQPKKGASIHQGDIGTVVRVLNTVGSLWGVHVVFGDPDPHNPPLSFLPSELEPVE